MKLALVLDCRDPGRLAPFWSAALDHSEVYRDASYIALRANDGAQPTLILQKVDEPRNGKNRMHLDLHSDDFDVDLERLVGLGARPISEERAVAGTAWVVLADPEGNEFCLVRST